MKRSLQMTLGLLALLVAAVANAGVSASLDNDQVDAGDSVQLTLLHDGRTNDQPDLSPLDKDFDVLGSQSSTSIQMTNGSTSASTQVTLTLSPKHSGTLIVPPITWSGERTGPLTLHVAGSGSNSQGGDQGQGQSANLFLETDVDSKQPLVQAAVNVTVKLYIAERLYRANLDLPGNDDAIVQKVGSDEQGEADRGGRTYQVITRHYVVFPQHSGQIKLNGAVLTAQVADRRRSSDPFGGVFGGQSIFGGITTARPVRLHGDDIALNVQPRPAGFENGYWLPARQVTLEGEWSPTNLQAHVGDPITLTLTLRAEGQTAAQLPDLSTVLQLPDGMKAYPDQAKLDNSARGAVVVGTRAQSIALIADEAGRFSIPALKVRWWDTQTGQARETMLPGRTLVILPATGASSAASTSTSARAGAAPGSSANEGASSGPTAIGGGSPPPPREAGPWRWIALALVALWLATLGAWLGSKWLGSKSKRASVARNGSSAVNESAARARAAFQAACRDNNALAARRALLAWARAKAPRAPPTGLNALAKQIGDPALAAHLRGLDRACYAGETWQDGAALANALTDLPLPGEVAAANQPRSSLAPLYP